MASFDITNPVFTKEIRKLEITDRAHADLFNELLQKIFGNTLSLQETCSSMVIIGPEDTELSNGTTLFVAE